MATAAATDKKVGKVVQVIGPVVDIEFEGGHLPAIYNAVRVTVPGADGAAPTDIVAEVEQHLGENRVRAGRRAAACSQSAGSSSSGSMMTQFARVWRHDTRLE